MIRSQRDTWTTSGVARIHGWPVADHLRRVAHARVGMDPVGRHEPGAAEQREHLVRREVLVLGGERVDRRGDDPQPCAIEPARRERLAREDVRMRDLHVRADELPRALRPLVRAVVPHVAPPDHPRADIAERREEPGGLWVVDEHHVAAAHPPAHVLDVRGDRPVVVRPLGLAEIAAVAGGAVEAVVDALGDREELGIARNDNPIRRDPDAARVAEQCPEHLGDPAAGGRGVHVHDASGPEPRLEGDCEGEERVDALEPDDRLEPIRVERWNLDGVAQGRRHGGSVAHPAACVLREAIRRG